MKVQAYKRIELLEYTNEKFIPENTNNIDEFLGICSDIKEIDLIPIKKLNVEFSSDSWDLSPLAVDEFERNRTKNFNFGDVPLCFKDISKFFIYWNVTQNRQIKLPSLGDYFKDVRSFLKYLNDKHITTLENVDFDIISNFFKYLYYDKGNKYTTLLKYSFRIKDIMVFYSKNMTHTDLSEVIKQLDKVTNKLTKLANSEKEENKHKNIPAEYFNGIITTFIKIMRNEELDEVTRGCAAMTVLQSQTGLRISQLLDLKVNATSETHLSNAPEKTYFLEFTIIKRNIYTLGCTVLNSLGYEAYTILDEVFKDSREKFNTDYLFCPESSKKLPVIDTMFSRYFKKIIFKFGHEIGAVNVSEKYPELTSVPLEDFIKGLYVKSDKLTLSRYSKNDTISYPTSHQFRVHLCTYLYNKGVPFEFIQKYMNHLTEDMSDYYVRRPEYSEKDDEFSDKILKVIIKEGTKPLGSGSEALMAKIDEFIEKGNFNIIKDIDTIIPLVKGRLPVRQKTGGMCIKSVENRDCRVDSQSDKIYCAYGVCPNHFHLYIMADITYNDCKTLIKTMEYNQAAGYTRQANKELGKLQSITKKALIPEIEQLEFELERKGYNWIKENHKNLVPIMDNLVKIKEEIEEWINKQPIPLKKK